MAAVAREAGASVAPSLCAAENTAPEAGCSGQSLPGFSTDLPSGLSPVPNPPSPRLCAPFTDKDGVSTEANANTELQSAPRADTELSPPLWDSGGGNALCESGPGAEQDPVQSAVSPLSLPAAPEAPEAGLSLGQPDGPDRACTGRTAGGIEREVCDVRTAGGELCDADRTRRSGTQRPETPPVPDILDPDQTRPGPADPEADPELRSGTHVRVSLDHVIDDALVVSYRVGNKVFSGVLMDLSHRFGPYGIPISTFPVRQESSRRHISASPPDEALPPAEAMPPDPVQTPLFHQGAPYPPPLFLRDSYHQGLPQPPPRRIKRSRRRYGNSEEPTCMLVRLRPRQVLCDRCKGVASTRPAPSTRRRPNSEPLDENLPTEVKRLRCDDSRPRPRRDESRPRRDESRPRREASRGPAPTPGAPRDPQTEVKRLRCDTSRPPRRDDTRARRDPPKGPSGSAPRRAPPPSVGGARDHRGLRSNAPGTRVLTRRISSALAPPRIRLKPHRYRTDPEPSPPPPKTRPRPGPDLRPETRVQTTNRNCKPKVQTRVSGRLRPGTKAGTRVEQKDPKTQDSRPEARPDPPLKPRLSSPSDPTPSRSRRKQVFPQPTRDFDLDFMGWSGPDSDQEQTQPEVENITVTETRPGPSPDPSLGSEPVYAHGPNPSSHQQTETPPDSSPVQRPDLVLPEFDAEPKPLVLKDSPPNHKLDLKPEPSPDLDPGLSTSLSPCLNKPDHSLSHSPNLNLETGLNPSPDLDPSPRLVPDIDCSPDQSPFSAPCSDSNPFSHASIIPHPPSPRPVSKAQAADRPEAPSHRPLLEAVGSKGPDLPCPPPLPEAMGSDGSDPPTRASRPVPKAVGSDGPDPPTRASRPLPKTVGSKGPDPPCPPPLPEAMGSDGPNPLTRASRPVPKPVGSDEPDHPTRASRPLPKMVESDGPDAPSRTPRLVPKVVSADGPDPPSRAPRPVPKTVGADGRCVCVGDIVWAKIAGFPWWPAKVLSLTVCRRGDGGGTVKQEVRVAWFGSRTTSVLPLSHSSPFLETFQARFDRKRKGPYRRAIAEAASAAKQLTPEVRALITQFET